MKDVKILLNDCKCSHAFAESVENVIKELGIDAKVTRIDNILQMLQYNVMTLPAIVVDEKVVTKGKIGDGEIRKVLSSL